MKRRDFIKTLTAIAAVSVLPLKLLTSESPVILYGDGVHDDTLALQAWGKGKRVIMPDGTVVGSELSGLSFFTRDTIRIERDNVVIRDCNFEFKFPRNGPVIEGSRWAHHESMTFGGMYT